VAEGDVPRDAALELGVAGPPLYARMAAYYGTAARRAWARWSARARPASRSEILCGLVESEILQNLQLKCPRCKYQSCRSQDPKQLLQRLYGVFLKGFCTNCCQTLNAARS
jgi:hypothetical protein